MILFIMYDHKIMPNGTIKLIIIIKIKKMRICKSCNNDETSSRLYRRA